MSLRSRRTFVLAVVAGSILFIPPAAHAVPSFARQTGLSCNGCHTTPPELNAAGRRFKLLGYTDRAAETPTVSNEPGTRHVGLDLLKALPLSAWLETSVTSTRAAQPGTQNGTFQLPQDVSLFLAGGWAEHIGSFLQITYDPQTDHFTMDNTDIRVAGKRTSNGKDLVYGLTLNNNPTVEDLWHTTPAWGFPFIASAAAPAPSVGPFIQGGLAQDVAGIGGYAMWNDHLYGAVTGYRSNHIATPVPADGKTSTINIQGIAPYWRFAWQQSIGTDNYFEVGTYGMQMKSTAGGLTGPRDRFTDTAIDAQYDRNVRIRDVISLRASYIRESDALDGLLDAGSVGFSSHHLRMLNANAEYHFGNNYSAALGIVKITGTEDDVLFTPSAMTGFANGSPNSTAYIVNLSWWPIQNVQLAAQYSGYPRFNGGSTNYDGFGRDARQNDTLYLLARFLF